MSTLYFNNNSICSSLTRLALLEKGIQFKPHHIALEALEQIQPWYMKINPLGQVPVFVSDSGDIVADSQNIFNYVESSPLYAHLKRMQPSNEHLLAEMNDLCNKLKDLPFFVITFGAASEAEAKMKPPVKARRDAAEKQLDVFIAQCQASNDTALLQVYQQKKASLLASFDHLPNDFEKVKQAWKVVDDFLTTVEERFSKQDLKNEEAPLYLMGSEIGFTYADARLIPILARVSKLRRHAMIQSKPFISKYWN